MKTAQEALNEFKLNCGFRLDNEAWVAVGLAFMAGRDSVARPPASPAPAQGETVRVDDEYWDEFLTAADPSIHQHTYEAFQALETEISNLREAYQRLVSAK